MSMGIVGEAQTAAAVLGHNFPTAAGTRTPIHLVKSGGLEPRENRLLASPGPSRRWARRTDRGFTVAHASPSVDPRHRSDRPARSRIRPGLAVLTGETGAGKSILLDAFTLALGGRGDSLVRHGAEQGQVTATFDVPKAIRPR